MKFGKTTKILKTRDTALWYFFTSSTLLIKSGTKKIKKKLPNPFCKLLKFYFYFLIKRHPNQTQVYLFELYRSVFGIGVFLYSSRDLRSSCVVGRIICCLVLFIADRSIKIVKPYMMPCRLFLRFA